MTLSPNTALRRFPSVPGSVESMTEIAGTRIIADLTHRPRIGLRGHGTPEWCRANELPFPAGINCVARVEGLRIARLGSTELLVLSESDAALPSAFADLPVGTYLAYLEETWAWFRMTGPGTVEALAACTSEDLVHFRDGPDRVVQTRFAGLDAVLVLSGTEKAPVVDIFTDIASHGYLTNVFAERCPEFTLQWQG